MNQIEKWLKISKKRCLIFCIISCLIFCIVLGILFGFVFNNDNINNNPEQNTKTKNLVESIIEGPSHCLLDDNCTSFTFNNSAIEIIRQQFNKFDGDGDDEWTKEEFIKFYIESLNGKNEYNLMDINNDEIFSYKEVVIFFMLSSELSIFQEFLIPTYEILIEKIYGYNTNTTTIYKDQLFWEYAAELFFLELDIDQEGFISKENYFRKLGELEFDIFGNKDEKITFNEFLNSRFSENGLDIYVNQNITALSNNYNHIKTLLNHGHSLLSELKLIHCLYSDIDFESIRRRLKSKIGCLAQIAICAGSGIATIAGCMASIISAPATFGLTVALVIATCGGGTLAVTGACYVCNIYIYISIPVQTCRFMVRTRNIF